MDQGGQAGGEDDAVVLPSVPLEPSAAGAEPAGLQSGEFVAAAGVASTNRELVADQSAATAGEDWRTAGEACALLLATAGGRTSDASAVRGDAGPYCSAADTDGIDRRGPLKQRNLSAKGSARRRSVAKVAEYRAISAGRVRLSEPLRGGQYENCFTLSANSGMGV